MTYSGLADKPIAHPNAVVRHAVGMEKVGRVVGIRIFFTCQARDDCARIVYVDKEGVYCACDRYFTVFTAEKNIVACRAFCIVCNNCVTRNIKLSAVIKDAAAVSIRIVICYVAARHIKRAAGVDV